MEHLKQIEDDINQVSLEVGKKYPEVAEASTSAIRALKAIREVYVANVVRRTQQVTAQNQSNKFLLSSELASPYIIICNYNDCNPKHLQLALNGLQLLLKHELVPVGDYQNILRVLMIQSSLPIKQDCLLKILQLVVQIATSFLQSQTNILFINEIIVNNLLSIPLFLADPRYSASVISAAQGTARQIVGLVVDIPLVLTPEVFTAEILQKSIECYSFIFREMSHFAGESSGAAIRLTYSPQILAIDCCYELLKGWAAIINSSTALLELTMSLTERVILPKMHIIQLDYLVIAAKNGFGNANSFVFAFCRIFRTLVVDIDFFKLNFSNQLIESLFLALQPCGFDQLSNISRQRSDESRSEEFSLMSKFFPIAAVSHVMGKSSSNSTIPSIYRPLFSEDNGMLHIISRNNSVMDDSIRFISSHSVACCMDIVLSIMAQALLHDIHNEENWRFIFNASTKLVVSSCEYISWVFTDPKCVKSIAKLVAGSHIPSLWNFEQERLNDFDAYGILHSIVANTTGLRLHDTLIYSVLSLRIAMNVIQRLTLVLTSTVHHSQLEYSDLQILIFPSIVDNESYVICANDLNCNNSRSKLIKIVQSFLDMAKEIMIESFHHVILLSSSRFLNEEIGQFICDMAISFCLLNDSKSLDIILTAICQHSISVWHGGDLAVAAHKSEEFSDSKRPEVNNYLLVLLIKLLSAVGNYCLDWDCVADCLNQAYSIGLHRLHGEVNSTERASAAAVSNALENIVNITSGLREENLVKFMTSFVALSASDMELMQGNQYSFDAFAATELVKILQDNQRQSSYISFTQWGGPSYFSFSIVVSTAKLNCYRISSIWQMVTSHIRLVMSSRIPAFRKLATASLFDILAAIISTTNNFSSSIPIELISEYVVALRPSSLLHLLPHSFLSPELLKQRNFFGGAPPLSQKDLLGSLTSVMSLEFSDVRQNIVEGLQFLLLHVGASLAVGESGGWRSTLEILAVIPSSLVPVSGQHQDISLEDENTKPWAHSCLVIAFTILKMICEEFLETILKDEVAITSAMELLQAFAAQSADVNISLTAVETMWKISGFSNVKSMESGSHVSGHVLFCCLKALVEDDRPDVRHCALNTLFMALSSNIEAHSASHVTLLEVHVLPLLTSLHVKLQNAVRHVSEQSKISLHHSRDSAFKQWVETLVLSHRGILRTIRSILKTSNEDGVLRGMVPKIVCALVKGAIVDMVDHEAFISCVDVLFGILGVCLESESPDSLEACLHIVQAIKVAALGGCAGNRDACQRIYNYINKILSDDKSVRIHSDLLNQGYAEIAMIMLLPVFSETSGSLRRVSHKPAFRFLGDDSQHRKSFFTILHSLKKGDDLPFYARRLLAATFFYQYPRRVLVNGSFVYVGLASEQFLHEIQELQTMNAKNLAAQYQIAHIEGAACSMSICNMNWIAEKARLIDTFSCSNIVDIVFPREFYTSMAISIEYEIVEPGRNYSWKCIAPYLNHCHQSIWTLIEKLLESSKGGKDEKSSHIILSTLFSSILCPWREYESSFVDQMSSMGPVIVHDLGTTLQNLRDNYASYRLIHKTVVLCICYGLLVLEKENSNLIHDSVPETISGMLKEYCSVAQTNTNPEFALGIRLLLKQLLNTTIACHNRQQLLSNSFQMECIELLISTVRAVPLEVTSQSVFWNEMDLFVEHNFNRTYGNLENLIFSSVQSDDHSAETYLGSDQNSYVQFYHQFLTLLNVLDKGPLRELIHECLRSIDVTKIAEDILNNKKQIAHLEHELISLRRELQNTAALSTFPF